MKHYAQTFKGSGVIATGAASGTQTNSFVVKVPCIVTGISFSHTGYYASSGRYQELESWVRCFVIHAKQPGVINTPAGVAGELMMGMRSGIVGRVPVHYELKADDSLAINVYMKYSTTAVSDITVILGYSFEFVTPEDGEAFEMLG